MGLYDEVSIQCPNCGEWFIEQTKAARGPRLRRFELEDAPLEVALDFVERGTYCHNCDHRLRVKLQTRTVAVVEVE